MSTAPDDYPDFLRVENARDFAWAASLNADVRPAQNHWPVPQRVGVTPLTVGADSAPFGLDERFRAAVGVVRDFPATADLTWDVQNSLAQRVVDGLAELFGDLEGEVTAAESERDKAKDDAKDGRKKIRALRKQLQDLGVKPTTAADEDDAA